jgi:hypothetical protein
MTYLIDIQVLRFHLPNPQPRLQIPLGLRIFFKKIFLFNYMIKNHKIEYQSISRYIFETATTP